jgi:tetratricopeptide (TPR) repeat protein
LSEDFKDEGRYKDLQNPVITTWLISFKQIQCQDQLAADLLSFMACINPRNIPQSLLPMPKSRKRGIDALGLLNAYAFINRQDTSINLHRLVHIAARNWLKKNALFSHWIQRAADQMRKVFPDGHYTNRGLWREYLPHALSLAYEDEFTAQWKEYIDLIQNIANCLSKDGRWNEAEVLYTELIRIKQEETGTDHPSALTSMALLATIYRNQGRWHESEKLLMQVLEMSKTVRETEHPGTLAILAGQAATAWKQGRLNEAEELELQIFKTTKTVLGPEHPDTLMAMSQLALNYWAQERWGEAEKLESQVLEMKKTVLGAEHPDTLTSMNSLAHIWKSQGKLQDALTLMGKCSELRNKTLGPNHPDAISSSRALSDWKDIHDSLPNESPTMAIIQPERSHNLPEIAAKHTAAALFPQSLYEERIKSPYTPRRSAAKLFLGDHPLLIASRRTSTAPEGQDLQEID